MMSNSTLFEAIPASLIGGNVYAVYTVTSQWITGVILELMQWSTIWKGLISVVAFNNAKNLPFIYHLRLVNAVRFVLKCMRPEKPLSPEHLFQPLITSSHVPLGEMDWNIHKSNSTYFTDIDVATWHLICTLFGLGIEKVRGGLDIMPRGKASMFGVALGGVSCSFRKELKPYGEYDLYTRVLSWDQKWLYVVTHFVKKGAVAPSSHTLYPQQKRATTNSKFAQEPDKALVASALSKLVFKKGGITIAPEVMLEASGLLPEKIEEIKMFKDADAINTPFDVEPRDKGSIALPTKVTDIIDDNGQRSPFSSRPMSPISEANSAASDKSNTESMTSPEASVYEEPSFSGKQDPAKNPRTREGIERERRRGMQMAQLLAGQADLANEFRANGEALGYHTDGIGAKGVISTLAQLAHITRSSSL